MEEENNKVKSIIPLPSNNLVRLENSINITKKILFENISELFNTAFYKMNSKHIFSVDKDYLVDP